MKIKMYRLVALVLLMMLSVTAYAEGITTYADAVFRDASINITSSGQVTYTASTRSVYNSISVSDCCLQLYTNGEWTTVATLPNPVSIANTQSYYSYTNCAAYFSSGKYRVIAVFSADDYSITRTSTERTFE